MLPPTFPTTGVLDVESPAEFSEAVLKAPVPTVVYFWASWARAHAQMDAVFTALASQTPKVRFIKVEAEEVPEVSDKFSVTVSPTFLFFQSGKVVDTLTGAHPPELTQKVNKHAASAAAAPAQPAAASSTASAAKSQGTPVTAPSSGTLEERMKALINSAPVMLFMKGQPSAPQCGFSRKAVALLQDANIKFSSFDILSDNEIRQGLKEYSSWPTYPQFYVNGQLLGGLDIVKEMHDEGELLDAIPDSAKNGGGAGGSLEERLKALTHQAPVMLFMKGQPSAPQCGFSRKIVDLLNSKGVKFDSFDILGDNEVRQGLKTFSNWPTFPQLYIQGELVGGLDIVTEMAESGELEEMLSK